MYSQLSPVSPTFFGVARFLDTFYGFALAGVIGPPLWIITMTLGYVLIKRLRHSDRVVPGLFIFFFILNSTDQASAKAKTDLKSETWTWYWSKGRRHDVSATDKSSQHIGELVT